MNDARRFGIVLTTVGDVERAREIARALVDRRLAACVNVVPGVRSTYRWQGKICEDDEILLIVKTEVDRFEDLRRALREIHPYDLPEAICVALSAGDPEYLRWIGDSVGPESVR